MHVVVVVGRMEKIHDFFAAQRISEALSCRASDEYIGEESSQPRLKHGFLIFWTDYGCKSGGRVKRQVSQYSFAISQGWEMVSQY